MCYLLYTCSCHEEVPRRPNFDYPNGRLQLFWFSSWLNPYQGLVAGLDLEFEKRAGNLCRLVYTPAVSPATEEAIDASNAETHDYSFKVRVDHTLSCQYDIWAIFDTFVARNLGRATTMS